MRSELQERELLPKVGRELSQTRIQNMSLVDGLAHLTAVVADGFFAGGILEAAIDLGKMRRQEASQDSEYTSRLRLYFPPDQADWILQIYISPILGKAIREVSALSYEDSKSLLGKTFGKGIDQSKWRKKEVEEGKQITSAINVFRDESSGDDILELVLCWSVAFNLLGYFFSRQAN